MTTRTSGIVCISADERKGLDGQKNNEGEVRRRTREPEAQKPAV